MNKPNLRTPLDDLRNPENRRVQVTAGSVDDSNYEEGRCPACDKQMVLTACKTIPAYVCLEHRIVLPLREQPKVVS